jgi:ABC-type branched-subunit amino acid transport system substrate-binding protein
MAFALRGIGKVQVAPVSEYSRVIRNKPDALVLASMEQSISFFSEYSKFLSKPKQLFLVPGNLANYSNYPWANQLKGSLGLLANTSVPEGFRNRLALVMKRPAIKTSNNPIVGLSYLTYKAVMLSGEAFLKVGGNNPLRLRAALLESESHGVRAFTNQGFANGDKYSVYQYSARGGYSAIGEYEPKQ